MANSSEESKENKILASPANIVNSYQYGGADSIYLRHFNLKSSNLSAAWKSWCKQFKIFLAAANLQDAPDPRKNSLLLHHMGPDCFEIFDSFEVDEEAISHKELVKKFDDYFVPKVNIIMERYNFFTRRQRKGETIDEFVTSLKNLSKECNFDNIKDDLVRDLFICGLHSDFNFIREKLLNEGDKKLDKILEMAKVLEVTKEQSKEFQSGSEQQNFIAALHTGQRNRFLHKHHHSDSARGGNSTHRQIRHQGRTSNTYTQATSSSMTKICNRCGQVHINKCPALGQICHNCNGRNHYAKMCKKSTYKKAVVNNIVEETSGSENEATPTLFIGVIKQVNNISSAWYVNLMINSQSVRCQVDTGAEANVMSLSLFQSLNLDQNIINKSSIKICTFSGQTLPCVGICKIDCFYGNNKYSLKFHILEMTCKTVLGLQSSIEMQIVKRDKNFHRCVSTLKNVDNVNISDFLDNYKEIFEGLGCVQNKCHLKVNDDIKPVVEPPRKIPFALRNELIAELERMEKLEVIKKTEEPTTWVSSIVLVKKRNGQLRLCLDPRNLNKAILRPHFPFPNLDEIKSRLTGAKYFSTLDANSGFWMLPLDEKSSKLCTFITPFGRYRFLRLPFGINAAPEIFHSQMVKYFEDLPNVIIYIDDFLIYSSTLEEHIKYLKLVLNKAKNIGLKFNKNKSHFCLKEIKFMGHIFNESGVRPDESKVEAICNMPRPTNISELQRFMGMVNYLGSFVKDLSIENSNLRQLLKKDICWHWSDNHENEFNKLKHLISNAPILAYYDNKKPITLSVDASKSAVGAVISHHNNPIAYASATLSPSQQNYAQIEKELFAILFGCTRFHQYVYGKPVLVETDHKPLVAIFEKPLYKAPARLQRFMLRLQAYDIKIQFKPGKEMVVADTLSRAPLKQESLTEFDNEVHLHCNLLISSLPVTDSKLEQIKTETLKDPALRVVADYYKNGWPENKKAIEPVAMPYYKVRNELHIVNDIVFMSNRIVIPTTMRPEMLNLVHEGHMGSERCINLARTLIYWPNINQDIKNIVYNCDTCIRHRPALPKEPLLSHDIVPIPWFKLGMDIFEFKKNTYLLVVDYYSNYVEIALLNRGYSSKMVITQLKSIFARHGIPSIIVSDNGTSFTSIEFKKFCHSWNIDHVTSSPYIARSNGLAERTIQTIKNLLRKSLEQNSDPYIALLHYRTTPNASSYSPSELLMGRKLRTKIPTKQENLKPIQIDNRKITNFIRNKQKKMATHYNNHSKPLRGFHEGEKVYYQKIPKSEWYPGVIASKCREPRSYMVEGENNQLYRRNRQHIIRSPKTKETLSSPQSSPISSKVLSPRRETSVSTPSVSPSSVTPTSCESSASSSEPNNNNRGGILSRFGRLIRPPTRFTFEE